MYLGSWYERTGQSDRADECFARRVAVDPQNPAALRAVGIGLAQQNKPREAEAKLKSFEPPSKQYEPAIFYTVATAYQRVGDHESALRLFKMVADATPSSAKEKKFRAAVQQSEAALGKFGAVLAPLPWYKRKGMVLGVLAAALLLVVVGLDRYFAQRRELFVVNGLAKPLKVKVDGADPVEVPAQGKLKLTAGEGGHTISVIEPAVLARDEQFTIPASIWGRWRGREVNLVDPTHSAAIVWEESVYAKNPRDQSGRFQLHAAEPFLNLADIDYKFEQFPRRLQVEGGTRKVVKHRVGMETAAPLEIIVGAPDALTGARRLDYLEAHLATAPTRDATLLHYYWQAVIEQQQIARCRDFLKRFLDLRPVDVEWHRVYQSAADLAGQPTQLAAEYDAMIAKEPESADLLYLRGRIEPYGADSRRFYDAALRKDPNHSFTLSASAFLLSSTGQFEEALAAFEKAIASDPQRGDAKGLRRQALLGLGRQEQVIRELREQIKPVGETHWENYPDLIHALAYQGNLAEANRVLAEFGGILDREWPQDPLQLKLKSRLYVLFEAKKYDELRAAAGEVRDQSERSAWVFTSYLCEGRPQDAATAVESLPMTTRGISYLCLSIAERNAQRDDQSKQWLQRAIDAFASGTGEERIVAQWLNHPPADLSQLLPKITDIALEPDDKAVVLLALAGTKGSGSEQLIALAERLNAWPSSRQTFVKTTLAAMR